MNENQSHVWDKLSTKMIKMSDKTLVHSLKLFLKTYNIEFGEIIITFTDQNGRPLQIKGKFNLTFFINK